MTEKPVPTPSHPLLQPQPSTPMGQQLAMYWEQTENRLRHQEIQLGLQLEALQRKEAENLALKRQLESILAHQAPVTDAPGIQSTQASVQPASTLVAHTFRLSHETLELIKDLTYHFSQLRKDPNFTQSRVLALAVKKLATEFPPQPRPDTVKRQEAIRSTAIRKGRNSTPQPE